MVVAFVLETGAAHHKAGIVTSIELPCEKRDTYARRPHLQSRKIKARAGSASAVKRRPICSKDSFVLVASNNCASRLEDSLQRTCACSDAPRIVLRRAAL